MNFCLLVIFLIVSSLRSSVNCTSDCGKPLLADYQYTCDNSHVLSSSSPYFPSELKAGVRQMTVVIAFQITNKCATTLDVSNLFSIGITPPGSSEVEVSQIKWTGGATIQHIYTDSNGVPNYGAIVGSTSPVDVGTWFELLVSIDLQGDKLYFTGAKADNRNYEGPAGLTYGLDWKFDSKTKFYICAGKDGSYPAACKVQSFSIWYSYHDVSTTFLYSGGLSPVLLGAYPMDESSGKKVRDLIGGIGSGSFGSSTGITGGGPPTWTGNSVKFTQTNQYIELPYFSLKSPNGVVQYTLTLAFWIRIDTPGNGYLFRYSSSTLVTDRISLKVASSNGIYGSISTYATTPNPTIPLTTNWRLVTATYVHFFASSLALVTLYIDGLPVMQGGAGLTTQTFASSDRIIIGGPAGFIGEIANFQIFSPGTQILYSPTCSGASFCNLNMGLFSSSSTNCISCPTTQDPFSSQCIQCPYRTSLSEYECEEIISYSVTDTLDVSGKVAKGVIQVANAFASGSSRGIASIIGSKIFLYIQFLNITYSEELEIALESFLTSPITLGFSIKFPNEEKALAMDEAVPYVFAKRAVPASFLLNFWDDLMVISIVMGLLFIFWTFELLYWNIDQKDAFYTILQTLRLFIQNFFLTQLYSIFGDVVLYSILEYRVLDFDNALAGGGFAVSFISWLIMVGVLTYHVYLIVKYQKIRKAAVQAKSMGVLGEYVRSKKSISVLFGDFKDQSILQQLLLFFFIMRDLLFNFMLTMLFEYPIVQTSLFLFLNLLILALLFIKRPFQSVFEAVQQYVYEAILLGVNLSVLVLASLDGREAAAPTSRGNIGRFIIAMNFAFNFFSLLFMLANLGLFALEFIKTYREKQRLKRKANAFGTKTERARIHPENMESNRSQLDTFSDYQPQNLRKKEKIERAKIHPENLELNRSQLDTLPDYQSQNLIKKEKNRQNLSIGGDNSMINNEYGSNQKSDVEPASGSFDFSLANLMRKNAGGHDERYPRSLTNVFIKGQNNKNISLADNNNMSIDGERESAGGRRSMKTAGEMLEEYLDQFKKKKRGGRVGSGNRGREEKSFWDNAPQKK